MTLNRIHATAPVMFQCYGPYTKKWGTVSHHEARDMKTVERRRANYPATTIQTRWAVTRKDHGKDVLVEITSDIQLVGAH